jgi:hypothetical protein
MPLCLNGQSFERLLHRLLTEKDGGIIAIPSQIVFGCLQVMLGLLPPQPNIAARSVAS